MAFSFPTRAIKDSVTGNMSANSFKPSLDSDPGGAYNAAIYISGSSTRPAD